MDASNDKKDTQSVPVSALRKNGHVNIRGRACRIVNMTTAKMLAWQSGRAPMPPLDDITTVWCDGPCGDVIDKHATYYICRDCSNYDLCLKCEADGVTAMAHAAGKHEFAKINGALHSRNEANAYRRV